jgi:hypothetical protein
MKTKIASQIAGNNAILDGIESALLTEQQEVAMSVYRNTVQEEYRTPCTQDFQRFYSYWCLEEGLFNDIEQSDIEQSDR